MRAVLLTLLLPGCQYFAVGNETDGGSDGSYGDDDDDDTTGPGVPGDVDCREPYETPAPGAGGDGECVTDVIACGDTIEGTTVGGSLLLSNEYEQAFEWCSGHGEGDELSGPERVYKLTPPDNIRVVSVRLGSCEQSQLLWYQTAQVCPAERVLCAYATEGDSRDQYDDILLSGSGVIWLVVEPLAGDGGNFTLTVDCLE